MSSVQEDSVSEMNGRLTASGSTLNLLDRSLTISRFEPATRKDHQMQQLSLTTEKKEKKLMQ